MLRTTAILGVAALTLATLRHFAPGTPSAATDVTWVDDLEEATAVALRTGRPMLVVFR